MRDPYDVLGVRKTSSADEIKRAYRKLAKKLHPDANNKDPKAAQRFAELNAAHEIVGDESKRKAFDRGEIDADGKPRFHPGFESAAAGRGFGGREGHFETFSWGPDGLRRGGGRSGGAGFKVEDILGDMFGAFGMAGRAGAGQRFEAEDLGRSQHIQASLTITLAEAVKGANKRLRLASGKELEVKIPAGVTDGQQIRLKGQGLAGAGGAAGDVMIAVTIAPHPLFKLDGSNLRLELPITLYEAVLGARVRVPTLEGAVELAIPPGTSAGRTFRLRGKGLPSKSGPGDLMVIARIVLPDGRDGDLDALMTRWREAKPYDPRKDFG